MIALVFLNIKSRILSFSAVTDALNAPAKFPGCSGTRNLHDNLSDLRAQVAANQKVQLVYSIIPTWPRQQYHPRYCYYGSIKKY